MKTSKASEYESILRLNAESVDEVVVSYSQCSSNGHRGFAVYARFADRRKWDYGLCVSDLWLDTALSVATKNCDTSEEAARLALEKFPNAKLTIDEDARDGN